MHKLYSNKLVIFSLVLPGLLTFVVAILAPIILSVYYSLTDYSGLGDATFLGIANYITLFQDGVFWRALLNSALLAIGFIFIQHPIAVFVAWKLDRLQGKAEGLLCCIYFLPNVISVAVIAYLWKFVYNPNFGLLQKILEFFGYEGNFNALGSGTAIWAVLVVLIWHGFGWGMLIYYTGIKNIDQVVYEAAAIDGATDRQIFFRALAVILVVIFAIMASFACTRMHWKLSGVVSMLLMMGLMIPIHATLLPNYIIFSKIKILDTIFALLIPYVAFSLPQGFFLTSSYMDSVPKELEEAAVIDGCGVYRTLLIIVLPMMKASIATVSIMTYLNNWNEFVMAMTFLSSPDWKTLPFAVLEFTGQYSSDYAIQFAVMTLSALPAIIIYILLNKNITKGVAMGAVKG